MKRMKHMVLRVKDMIEKSQVPVLQCRTCKRKSAFLEGQIQELFNRWKAGCNCGGQLQILRGKDIE